MGGLITCWQLRWNDTKSPVFSKKCGISVRQAAIQKIQDIFREKADGLYYWADDHTIPADNNLAEQELLPPDT